MNSSFFLQIENVIFNPFGYIHPSRLNIPNGLGQDVRTQQAINLLIIDTLRLEVKTGDFHQDDIAIIKCWNILEQVVYVMGCCVSAHQLTRQGKILQAPAIARYYLSSCDKSYNYDEDTNDTTIMCRGYEQLHLLTINLSIPIRQRLPLIFAPLITEYISGNLFTVNVSLLNMAINYVQNNQIVFPHRHH